MLKFTVEGPEDGRPFASAGSEASQHVESYERKAYEEGTSCTSTYFNFVKSLLGTGLFAAPFFFLSTGLIFGSANMILLNLLCLYTYLLLLECKRYLYIASKGNTKQQSLGFYTIVRLALGKPGGIAVNIAMITVKVCAVATFFVFIRDNLRTSLTCLTEMNGLRVSFTVWECYAMFVPIAIFLTWLPSVKYLTYSSYFGTAILATAIGLIFYYGGHVLGIDNWKGVGEPKLASIRSYPGVFGIAFFSFAQHTDLFPLESRMRRPSGMKCVLGLVAASVVIVNLSLGICGYLMFGDETAGYIFQNLPNDELFPNIIRLLLALQLTFTFPIALFPLSEMSDAFLKKLNIKKIPKHLQSIISRTLIVLLTWSIALAIPLFEEIMSLTGGLGGATIATIFPSLAHLALKRKETSLCRNGWHIVIFIFGIFAFVLSVVGSTLNILKAYRNGEVNRQLNEYINCSSLGQDRNTTSMPHAESFL